MSFQIAYKPLARITIHHDFYLDEGADKFVDLSDEEKKSQLASYDFLNFLKITPTPITQRLLQNHKVVLRNTGSELLLYVNVEEYNKAGESTTAFCPKIEMDDDLEFTFELRFSDTYFNNYTNSAETSENQLYFFSNKRPDSESNAFPNFFIDQEVHTDFLLQPEGSREIIHDVLTKEIAPVDDLGLEIILAIDDTDIEVPENATVLNTYIETQKRNGLLGYIRLAVQGDGNVNLLEDTTVEIPNSANQVRKCLPETSISPIVRFENRKTFWRYNRVSTEEVFVTKNEYPLTQNGFIKLRPNQLQPRLRNVFLLNPGKSGVSEENDDFYSEIFI